MKNKFIHEDSFKKYISLNKFLLKKRYPSISDHKENIGIKIKNLNVDNNIKIILSNNYVELKYLIQIYFNNLIELDAQLKKINNFRINKDFIALFDY